MIRTHSAIVLNLTIILQLDIKVVVLVAVIHMVKG